jgi:putative transposase
MIHAVWATKNRQPILQKPQRFDLYKHIVENAKSKGIVITEIGGYTEHIHCLFELPSELSIAKSMQLIKGEASFWANKQNLFPNKIEWAEDYFAASVSESNLPKVIAYIQGQEEHHKQTTFAQEFEKFISEYKFKGG